MPPPPTSSATRGERKAADATPLPMARPRAFAAVDWPFLGLAFSIFLPSSMTVQRYLGGAGVALYALFVAAALWLGRRALLAPLLARLRGRTLYLLAALTFLSLLLFFLVLYPIANSGLYGGGSDIDESLDLATLELVRGNYPYYPVTYLGNPITQMPGALAIAVPFTLNGTGAYQVVPWLAVFWLLASRVLRSGASALLLLWTVLLLSPGLIQKIAVGNDQMPNSLSVMALSLAAITIISRREAREGERVLSAALVAVGLAWRSNFLFILPLLFSAIARRRGARAALRYVGVTVGSFAALVLPFLLYDWEAFSPRQTARKIAQFELVLPGATFLIPLLVGTLALWLAFKDNGRVLVYLRNCALVLALPVALGTLLQSVAVGRPYFDYAQYGAMFVFFGALACWPGYLRGARAL